MEISSCRKKKPCEVEKQQNVISDTPGPSENACDIAVFFSCVFQELRRAGAEREEILDSQMVSYEMPEKKIISKSQLLAESMLKSVSALSCVFFYNNSR